MKFSPIVVLSTTSSLKEARKIAQHLLDSRLVACVNISAASESHYVWKGKRCREKEFVLLIKSERRFFSKLSKALKSVHSYEVPEIIALPVESGNQAYLAWLKKQLR